MNYIISFAFDSLQIYFQERSSHFYGIAVLYESLIIFSVQVYRVEPHMDQQLYARVRDKANGMPGTEDSLYGSFERRHEVSVFRENCCAFSENFFRKSRIIYV